MQIRTDSRGSPIRRTFLGNLESYMVGQQIMESKMGGRARGRKGSNKLTAVGINVITDQPTHGTSHLSPQPDHRGSLMSKDSRNVKGQ